MNTYNKVPLVQKIAFGIGMLGNQMFPAALGIFMVVMAIGSIFSIEFITNAPLVDLSREQLNEFRTRTVRPSLFLTCAYFIFRYFIWY